MVFDKIRDFLSGDADLGDVVSDLGVGDYSQYLEGVSFPINKDDLIMSLQENGAQDSLVQHVQSLSQDRFQSADEVFRTLTNR